jgi:hypothetical protein
MKNQVKDRSYVSGSFKKLTETQKADALEHFNETAKKIIKNYRNK